MDKTKTIAALFDFDGVVMDTESQYTIYWNEIGRKYHPDIENFGLLIKGQTLSQIYDRFFKGMEAEQAEITKGLNKFESEMKYEYVSGVVDFMKELREKGVKTAIVTSSNEKKMANVYSVHPELKNLVDRILTAEMFTRSKPAPDCFLLGAEVFGTVADNCVVFEDSFHGLQAGKAAGMKVVGLSTTNSKEAITGKCDMVIPDFADFTYSDVVSLLDK
ncbi:HAD family phosphatase [uncultured Bacteroides sp.]|uniref:HAD family hydrolase n=1 Tax=uncultured Bacteroides sp. TaxID=162156 RepID=UPI002608E7CE|nr:HAD family hydrolase [uncultured Bacteroides sp.]